MPCALTWKARRRSCVFRCHLPPGINLFLHQLYPSIAVKASSSRAGCASLEFVVSAAVKPSGFLHLIDIMVLCLVSKLQIRLYVPIRTDSGLNPNHETIHRTESESQRRKPNRIRIPAGGTEPNPEPPPVPKKMKDHVLESTPLTCAVSSHMCDSILIHHSCADDD